MWGAVSWVCVCGSYRPAPARSISRPLAAPSARYSSTPRRLTAAMDFERYNLLDDFVVAHMASAPVGLCACTLPYEQQCDARRCRACRETLLEIVDWCHRNLRDRHGQFLARLYVRRALLSDLVIWNAVRRGQLDRRHAAHPPPPVVVAAPLPEACAICMEDLLEEVAIIPCRHRFHAACLIRWARRQRACPMCRRLL